jgi:uncharacterized protein (TIGR02594 family)
MSVVNRRLFSVGVASTGLVAAMCAAGATSTPSALPDYTDFDGDLPQIKLFGTNPALTDEQSIARAILLAAPKSKPLLTIAQYFADITRTNVDNECYNAAWHSRWNPVIVGFYKSTTLEDKYVLVHGDTIPWCAAFLNWCLGAAGKPTTDSASSSSFRVYGEATTTPQAGDIVVFKSADPALAAVGHGHVCIYLGMDGERIKVLGGNQTGGKQYSSVCETRIPQTSSVLVLHSFRSLG